MDLQADEIGQFWVKTLQKRVAKKKPHTEPLFTPDYENIAYGLLPGRDQMLGKILIFVFISV